jgi:UDP-N-acetylglucosamine 2-epimerase (non-hydrolysing)
MIHFIIGTRAQLFKMAPIMIRCREKGLAWRWVYTAQHKDTISETLDTFGLPEPDCVVVNWETEAKTMGKFLGWFVKMLLSLFRSRKILGGHTGRSAVLLTHGDTTTTWIAALYGKLTGTRVMHVEAGLRSFNLFKPFPEEINRLITFRLSRYYACPGEWAVKNLKGYRGEKVNTGYNTQLDTIRFGRENCDRADIDLPGEKYVVASLHRYENIFNRERFEKILEELEKIAAQFRLLFVQHPATAGQLHKFGMLERLASNERIILLPRLEYLPFIKAAKYSEFVITDGGGNQEELYYMGQPTLVFRNETERQEGLGTTAVISGLDSAVIDEFIDSYPDHRHDPVELEISPAAIIVDFLEGKGYGANRGMA